jgi:hypothetical protein
MGFYLEGVEHRGFPPLKLISPPWSWICLISPWRATNWHSSINPCMGVLWSADTHTQVACAWFALELSKYSTWLPNMPVISYCIRFSPIL